MHAHPAKGYFSLIQYCPDLGRLEAANVGVLLFCPERSFLKALTTRTNARIRRFFGAEGQDWERINSFKQGIIERIEREGRDVATLDDLQRFIAQRANLIQLTPPRPMKVLDPEADLQALFDEYLGEDRESEKLVRRIFDDNQVKLFRTSDLPRLIDVIRQTGQDVVSVDES